MNFPSGDQVETIIVGLASLAVAGLSFIYASKAQGATKDAEEARTRAAEVAVDAQAYSRAKDLYESSIKALVDENRRLLAYVDGLKHVYDSELTVTAQLREHILALNIQLDWFRQNWAAKGFVLPPDARPRDPPPEDVAPAAMPVQGSPGKEGETA